MQGRAIAFPEPEPWPEPVDGAALLDEIAKAIGAHVVMPEASRDACALWVAHTFLLDCHDDLATAGDHVADARLRQDHGARRDLAAGAAAVAGRQRFGERDLPRRRRVSARRC